LDELCIHEEDITEEDIISMLRWYGQSLSKDEGKILVHYSKGPLFKKSAIALNPSKVK